MLPGARFVMTGRDLAKTSAIAATVGATPIATVTQLLAIADIVVTATPSGEPLFASSQVRQGTHFVALGADGPEKQELPTDLFARAAHVLCDAIPQCAVLSDFGKAVNAGAIGFDSAIALGNVLSGNVPISRMPDDITIVDLTGLAAQDIAIADWFGSKLA